MFTKKEQQEMNQKCKIFQHVEQSGNITFTCRHFGISRDTYYRWKRQYETDGEKFNQRQTMPSKS